MSNRNKAARVLVAVGCILLFASTALHSFAAQAKLFPALSASNLSPELQAALRVVFLSVGWHWIVIAVVALLAAFKETGLRKTVVLLCGLSVLAEAVAGAVAMGLFIGNEIIGGAALLIVCGGLLCE